MNICIFYKTNNITKKNRKYIQYEENKKFTLFILAKIVLYIFTKSLHFDFAGNLLQKYLQSTFLNSKFDSSKVSIIRTDFLKPRSTFVNHFQ